MRLGLQVRPRITGEVRITGEGQNYRRGLDYRYNSTISIEL